LLKEADVFLIIVIIAVVTGILFITAGVSLGCFIYNGIKKNETAKKKNLKVLIPSAIACIALIAANTVLITMFVYKNRSEIADKAVRIPAEMTGKGLALTFQNFEKNWDKNRLLQLQNLHLSPSSMNYEIKNDMKIYDIELIFDNQSPIDVKLYFNDLIGNHYLVVCDKDDFVYLLETSGRFKTTKIPFGKSKFEFTATVPEDVEIKYARFVDEIIPLP
jgi:hypothetical protein